MDTGQVMPVSLLPWFLSLRQKDELGGWGKLNVK